METKTCKECGKEKTLDNFYYNKNENRYAGTCTPCCSLKRKKQRQNDIAVNEKANESCKLYYQNNKELVKRKQKEYREKNKEELNRKHREYREKKKNEPKKDKVKEKAKIRREEIKKKIETGDFVKPDIESKECTKCGEEKDISEFTYYKNKNVYDSSCKGCNALRERERRAKKKDEINARRRQIKKPLTIQQKVKHNLRKRLNGFVKKRNKKNLYSDLLGCELSFLMKWFEYIFELDKHLKMTWENYGDSWHIDHVTPCDSFDLEIKENQEKCFHWTNLCPVLKEYNLEKGNKIVKIDIEKQKSRVEKFKIKMQKP